MMESEIIQFLEAIAMKTIPLSELSKQNIQITDLQVFPENWTREYHYTRYKNSPRPNSGLFIVCTDIHAQYYENGMEPVVATRGDVIFIPKGVRYHAEVLDGKDDLIDSYTLNFQLQDAQGEDILLSDHIQIISSRPDDLLTIRATTVSSAFHQTTPRNMLRLYAALYHLLDAIAASAEEQLAVFYPIRPGVDALRNEWNQNRLIEDYAEKCCMSAANFYRCFRKWCGKSPVQFRNEIRLSNAESMLRNTDLQISEISKTVGFPDAFYFCRLFSKLYGLSPRKYRAAFGREENP
jgi:AraC-like DNA-binding protein